MITNRQFKFAVIVILLAAGLTAVIAAAQDDAEAKIENAMGAAPLSVSQDATIVDVDAEGTVLREGTNGWTCFPDWPASPGNDPACYDAVWMEWNTAFAAGEDPNITVMGLAYMLQGGSDPSNSDPSLTEPPPGEDWMTAPPHIMVILPEPLDTEHFTSDMMSGGPWVMWAGTPYEHIMMPISEAHEHE